MPPNPAPAVGLHDLLQAGYEKTDRALGILILCHLPVGLGVAWYIGSWVSTLVVGGLLSGGVLLLTRSAPQATLTRMTVAVALMGWSALLIHQSHGLVEMRVHIFASLAFLLAYRDWRVVVVAATAVAVHHVAFHFLQQAGVPVFVFPTGELHHGVHRLLILGLHALFVVLEAVVLVWLSRRLASEARTAAQVLACASRIARGDIQVMVAADSPMATALGEAVETLGELVVGIGEVVTAAERGDLTRRMGEDRFEGAFAEVARGVNRTVASLESTQTQMESAQREVRVFLQELSGVCRALGQGDLTRRMGTRGRG